MKKYGKYATCLLMAVVPMVVTSCSDDDTKEPSREIAKVEIYKAEGDALNAEAQYKFTYDGRGRLTNVRTDAQSQEVSYTYGASSIAYRWEGYDAADGLFVNRFEAGLHNGRVQVGSVNHSHGTESSTFNYAYYYNSRGYITSFAFASDQIVNYQWGKQTLLIESIPQGLEAEYRYSAVQNDYSIDLNVLQLFVDPRADIMLVLNAYGQLGGVLGSKYPTMLEDIDYTYRYQFDAEGRLVQIIRQPASLTPDKQDTHWFLITYSEEA